MANKFTKLFNTQKSKNFWVYLVVGALFMIASIMLMPFWTKITPDLFFASWGLDFVKIIIACVIVAYLIGFLLKKIKLIKIKSVKVVAILEFVILSLVAIGCIVSQFSAFALDASTVLSIAFLMRGTVEIFRAYYYNKETDKYSLFELILAILLVAFGGYLFSKRFITNELILWIATGVSFIVSLIVFILGFCKKPKGEKKPKKEKPKKEKKQKSENK